MKRGYSPLDLFQVEQGGSENLSWTGNQQERLEC